MLATLHVVLAGNPNFRINVNQELDFYLCFMCIFFYFDDRKILWTHGLFLSEKASRELLALLKYPGPGPENIPNLIENIVTIARRTSGNMGTLRHMIIDLFVCF